MIHKTYKEEFKDIYEKVKEKGISDEEFEQKSKEFLDMVKNVEIDDIKEYLKVRWGVYLAKLKIAMSSIPHVNLEKLIPIGITKTDFGRQKKYDEAIRYFNENPEDAVRRGITDTNGTPLDESPFNKGKPLIVETTTIINAIVKEEGEDYKLANIRLGKGMEEPKLFNYYKNVKVGKTKNQTQELTSYTTTRATTWGEGVELKEQDLNELFDKIQIKYIKTLQEFKELLDEKFENNEGFSNTFYIIKDATIASIFINPNKEKSDMISFLSKNLIDENEYFVMTSWIDKSLTQIPRRIKEGAYRIILIGNGFKRINEGSEDYILNLKGLFVPKKYLVEEIEEPPVIEEKKEVKNEEEFI